MKSSSRHSQTQNAARVRSYANAKGKLGVLQRIKYASVVCVSPVASFHRTGTVFGFYRRICLSSFGTASPRRRATRPGLSRRPSCQASLRLSPPSPCRADVARGSQRAATAGRRLCRYQPELHGKQPPDGCAWRLRLAQRRHGGARRSWPSCPAPARRAHVRWERGVRKCRRAVLLTPTQASQRMQASGRMQP